MTVTTARIAVTSQTLPLSTSLINRMSRRFSAAVTRSQLRELDDRMLKDIGLTRADIEAMRFMN